MNPERLKTGLKKIGENMARHRKGQRISQRSVAKDIGGSQSRISRWEKGSSSPRLEDFLCYADAIHARPETIIAGAITDSVEQLASELDPAASQVVTDLVVILHDRRPTGPGATGGAAA
jgi:transcriptional regulator with XRE-family HTH domain